jgi:hypothetical protein
MKNMNPLNELAARLKKSFPDARLNFSEPAAPGGVGFLDISYRGNVLEVQWQEGWKFGVSSPEGHGYGERPDEVYGTVEEAAGRIAELLGSNGKTEPPPDVTLRQLRAERNLHQTGLAALLGVSQPAVSRLERHVSRMCVASLRAVIQAMGGNLVIQAHFPNGVVRRINIDDGPAPRLEQNAVTT